MALQHGDECWCSYDGNMEYDRHGRGEFGECDMMCGGEDSTTCGGRFAFDLYKLSWPEPEDNGEYVQCFGDLRESRVMDEKAMMIRDDMTVIKCKEHCTKVGGAKFYGLQVREEPVFFTEGNETKSTRSFSNVHYIQTLARRWFFRVTLVTSRLSSAVVFVCRRTTSACPASSGFVSNNRVCALRPCVCVVVSRAYPNQQVNVNKGSMLCARSRVPRLVGRRLWQFP